MNIKMIFSSPSRTNVKDVIDIFMVKYTTKQITNCACIFIILRFYQIQGLFVYFLLTYLFGMHMEKWTSNTMVTACKLTLIGFKIDLMVFCSVART